MCYVFYHPVIVIKEKNLHKEIIKKKEPEGSFFLDCRNTFAMTMYYFFTDNERVENKAKNLE